MRASVTYPFSLLPTQPYGPWFWDAFHRFSVAVFCTRLLLLSLVAFATPTIAASKSDFPPAPGFPLGLDWLNVTEPLTLEDLTGKVVILDFWTYGCINCIHVMEELAALKKRFGHKLVVVGVHSPKFDNERNLATLRSILIRYNRTEPVVNDPDKQIMRLYGARAWPTLAVIDQLGGYVGKVSGEGNEVRLTRAIETLLEIYADQVDERPIDLVADELSAPNQWFAAPEKIAATANRVAVSDTLLHRVLVTDSDGHVLYRVGGPTPGYKDGTLAEARFQAPRGLAFTASGDMIVADSGNHALRRVDFNAGTVSTIAGTGRRGLRDVRSKKPLELDLRSPWDLAIDGQNLYVAMAGEHQIWRMDLANNEIAPYAGSGREGIADGQLKRATFSQPSGLALEARTLFVTDAEASAIRAIDLDRGQVTTLIGTGLFDFGDQDGDLGNAQLQHATGIAIVEPGQLMVADTYNHKIKRLNLRNRTISTILGTGQPGNSSIPGGLNMLNEPSGLTIVGQRALIADTNNSRLLSLDLQSGDVHPWIPYSNTDP